jgi:predicted Ser/Thr protein kinase
MGTELPSGEGDLDDSIGRKAVDVGLITAAQLRDVLMDLTKLAGASPDVGAALVSRGLLSSAQLDILSGAPLKRVGKYAIVRELGRGGMGVVYEAEDSELDRRVALKMLLGSLNSDPREDALEEERFIREARLSANLPKHPHIIGVYEAGILDGRRFIAMEFIEGLQFSEWRRQGSITLRQQVSVLRDAAMAVEHAHKHGIIHRDLKPANILVDSKSRPHVADFGLAKRTNQNATLSITASGMVMGTPAYMSPEQAAGGKVIDHRSDLWSLGVMLYEILTGRIPFDADSPVKVLMKTVNDPVPLPSSMLRGKSTAAIDAAIEGICMKALAKNPKMRYASAKAFADDLGHWLKGERLSLGIAPRRSYRTPALIAAAAAGVVCLVGAWIAFTPSAADRARDFVEDGRLLMKKGDYSAAHARFVQAKTEDPSNDDAVAGEKKALERMLAAARPQPVPPDPKKTLEALQKELAELDPPLSVLREQETFSAARDLLTQAARRHSEDEWTRGVASRVEELRKAVDALFLQAKAKAVDSAKKGDAAAVDAAKRRVARWKWPGLDDELAAELARVKPAVVAPPAPAPAATGLPSLREVAVFRSTQNAVNSLGVSADGRSMVGTSWDNAVHFWDVPSRLERAKLAEGKPCTRAAISPDGRWIAAGFVDGSVRIWDTAKLQERVINDFNQQIMGLAFSPDSASLIGSSADGNARIWDAETAVQKKILSGHPAGAIGVSVTADGRYAAVPTGDGPIKIWQLPEGTMFKLLEGPPKAAFIGTGWSPDGSQLAAAGESGILVIFDVSSGASRTLGKPGKVTALAWSPDGRCIATASPQERALRIWDPATGNSLSFPVNADGYFSVGFAANGSVLAAGSADWTVHLWSLK